jgi:hypothetical protein
LAAQTFRLKAHALCSACELVGGRFLFLRQDRMMELPSRSEAGHDVMPTLDASTMELPYAAADEFISPEFDASWIEPLTHSDDPVTDVMQIMRRKTEENGLRRRFVQRLEQDTARNVHLVGLDDGTAKI